MNNRRHFLLYIFIAMILLPASALAIDESSLGRYINEVTAKMRNNRGSRIGDQDLGGCTIAEKVEGISDQGAWSCQILSYWSEHQARQGFLSQIRRNALFTNHGDRLEFLYSTESINMFIVEQVKERASEGINEVINAHPALQTSVTFEDNRFWVQSFYDYSQGTEWDDIVEPLFDVMAASQDLTSQIHYLGWKVNKEFRKELGNHKFDSIGIDEFCAVIDRNYTREDIVNDPVSEYGEWWFKDEGYSKKIVNRGTSMEVGFVVSVPEGWGSEEQETFLSFAESKMKKPGKANDLLVRWNKGAAGQLEVLAVYDIGGKKGKDIVKAYDSADDLVAEGSEKLLEEVENINKESRKAAVTSLSRTEFMALMADDLESLTAIDDTPTGHWNFKLHELDFDLYNYGDRMMVGFSFGFPEGLDEGDKENIIEKATKKAQKDSPKGLVVTAGYFFRNTNYLYVRGDMEYGQPAEEIYKAYHEFLYDYSEKAGERVAKLLN